MPSENSSYDRYGVGHGYMPAPPKPEDSETFAQDTYAGLITDQWSDWQQRYQPVTEQMLQDIDGTALLDEQLGRIRINNGRAFATANANMNRRMERYGINQSSWNTAGHRRQTGMDKALALAQSNNATRQHVADRRDQMLTGAFAADREQQLDTGGM